MSENTFPDLQWLFDVTKLPRAGTTCWFEADADAREALVKYLDLLSLEQFSVTAKITARKKRRHFVVGQLMGKGFQSCVVTLKPVEFKIDVNFERLLSADDEVLDSGSSDYGTNVTQAREVIFDPTEADPPDLFDGKMIDVGLICIEELALHLDPFPRHTTAEDWREKQNSVAAEEQKVTTGKPNPFAALAGLKADGE